MRQDDYLVQLMHDGGLADSGITRQKHQFRFVSRDHPIEGGQEGLAGGVTPIELFWDKEPVWHVLPPHRERLHVSEGLPFHEAFP